MNNYSQCIPPGRFNAILFVLLSLLSSHLALSQDFQALLMPQQQVYKFTLHMEDVIFAEVIKEIENKSDYVFIYSHSNVDADQIVSVNAKSQSIEKILKDLLKPFNLEFTIVGNQIILKNKSAAPSTQEKLPEKVSQSSYVQRISGQITDSGTDEPVPGVNVLVKNTTIGTVTDLEGRYSLSVPDTATTLIFSSIGYITEEIPINGRTEINLALRPDIKSLQEVVVVGYGTQSTRDITGSIENIELEKLQDAPVAQVGQMLQGAITGVRINQTTGRPGEGIKIQIRGAASITAGADPLYVIDGMPISGDISDINPAEIESISVLKDAAATSLYGSRAANGVVLIQTKTARPGQTQINFSTYYGFENVPESRQLNMMNAQQYAQFQKEIAEYNNREVDPVFQNPEQYAEGTDWYDAITQTGQVQSYNLTVSTGQENFNTSVTAGYFNQEGVVIGTGYQRFSLRANTRFQPHEKLNIGFNIAPNFSTNSNFNSDGNPYGSGNIISSALITTPLASPYNPDGSLALTATDPATFGNPNWLRVAQEKVYDDEDLQLLSNAYVEYEIVKGLTAKTTANIQLGHDKLFQFNPSTIGTLFNPPPRIPSGVENNYRFYNWVNENTLNYHTAIGEHQIDALAGFTAQHFRSENTNITGTNYSDDKIQSVGAAGVTTVVSNIQEWALLSLLARVNYSYQGKYLFSASIRRDGSSRFGPENRWGNFPSASVGWIVSDEGFWNIEPVTFLKLRASYGVTGNFEIGNYTYRSTLSPTFYVFDDNMFQGRAANNLGDQSLGWERNQQLNIGGDINLFNDRLQLTYNYYSKRTSNLLYDVNVPQSSGFSSLQTNIGELKLWGHEIGINTYNVSSKNLSWNTNFNISFDRNEALSLDARGAYLAHGYNLYDFYSHRTEVGRPIGMFYGAIQDGVYVNQADFDNSPKHSSSQVGTIKFRDLNGDGVITFPEDNTIIGSPWPDFTFGLTNRVNYKNFDLSVVMAGSYGNQILAFHENYTTNLDGVFNVLEEVQNRWKSPEDPGEGKYGSTQQGTTFLERDRWHTRYLKDGSYLSFKNITLGYTFPFTETSVIRNLRVYGSVQNALMITNYPGPNPEVNTQNNSSGSTPGFDANSYPVPRTISFGVNLGF